MSTNTLVRIVERDPGDYGKVSLAGVGTPIAKVTSSTVSPAVEGGKVTVRLTRKGGVAGSVVSTWTWVDDKNKQIPGSKTVTLTNFAEGIKGDSDVEIPVPVRTGFQKSQTWTLKWSLASGCKATASGLSSVKFKVSDSTYGGKVAAYSSGDVTKPAFKASGTDWYLGSDGSLRSSNPAAGKSLSTTVAVTGPGTLKFHAAFEDGTDCSLKVSGGDATVTVKADGDYAVHFGAGKKTLKFTFSRPSKKGVDTAAVAISGIEFVPDVGFRTIGTFTGPVTVDGVPGLATVTVAGSGKTSGKFQCADRTWTFSSKTGWDTKTWTMTVSAKSGSAKVEGLVFGIDPSTGVMTNGVSPECDWSVSSMLVRNAWADAPALSETIDRLSPYVGSYAVLLPGDEDCGHGYLSLTVSDSGAVKAVGYLADGRSVSLSGALALDAGGHAVTYLYTSPSAYNKGWFAVQVAFGEEKGVRVLSTAACDPLDALEYNWVSNASAGFCREVGVCGGECAAQLTDVDVASDAALSALTLSVKGEACPVQAFGGSVDDCAGICFGDDGEVRIRETGDSRLLTATVTASTGVVVGKVRIRFANAAGEVVTTKSYSYRGIMTPNVPGGSAGVAGGGFVSVDGRSYRVDFRGAADE